MATAKKTPAKKSAAKKTAAKKTPAKKGAAKKAAANGGHKNSSEAGNPCWEGYEPTPGKKPGTQGSCKPEK